MSEEIVVNGTPVEGHWCGSLKVDVKREDLCCPYPGPGFAKIRGVYEHIKNRPEQLIGVLDTYHSRGGWAVAYCCKALDRACVVFYPQYKDDKPGELRRSQAEAKRLRAAVRPLTAGRSSILYHQAKKLLPEEAYLMPNALKLPETIEGVAAEVKRTPNLQIYDIVVVSISSATIASGVMKGLRSALGTASCPLVVLHMGYSRSEDSVMRYVQRMSGGYPINEIVVVDEGYAYRDRVDRELADFPCDPYYDLKAWTWLNEYSDALASDTKVLFWNVG